MPSGGGGSNSVYGVNPGFDCFLIAQDDGNLVIYRGQNPSDNQGVIWASNTRKKQKAANPDQTSSNSVNGNNYMTTGQTLSSGQFLANDKGTIVLEWNNGKLELVTFEMGPNEMKTNEFEHQRKELSILKKYQTPRSKGTNSRKRKTNPRAKGANKRVNTFLANILAIASIKEQRLLTSDEIDQFTQATIEFFVNQYDRKGA